MKYTISMGWTVFKKIIIYSRISDWAITVDDRIIRKLKSIA